MHALLAQDGPPLDPWLLVAAAGVLALVVLLLAAPLLRRRNDPPAQVKDLSSSPSSSAAAMRPIGSASAGASDTSGEYRAIERDIQTLIAELSEMTRRANAQFDARAAKLEQLLREADDRLARLAAATGAGGDGATAPSRLSVAAATSSSDDGIDPRHVEIYTLCEQGFSPQQIAERLKRPSGEVELIIALRPRSQALGASRE